MSPVAVFRSIDLGIAPDGQASVDSCLSGRSLNSIRALILRSLAMPLLSLTFVIVRKAHVSRKAFEDLVCEPALALDLGGRMQYEGGRRFTVMVEGKKRDVIDYRTYITVGKVVFGDTSHFTEYEPTARVFGDSIKISYRVEARGTQKVIDDDVKL